MVALVVLLFVSCLTGIHGSRLLELLNYGAGTEDLLTEVFVVTTNKTGAQKILP